MLEVAEPLNVANEDPNFQFIAIRSVFPRASNQIIVTKPEISKPQLQGVILEKEPNTYVNICAALDIAPNTVITATEAGIRTAMEIDLRGNYLGGKGFEALTILLLENTNLCVLDVSGCGLTNESVVAFTRSIITLGRNQSPLKRLLFDDNEHLSLCSGQALLQLVRAYDSLREISLKNTKIEPAVIKKINNILTSRVEKEGSAVNSEIPLSLMSLLTNKMIKEGYRNTILEEKNNKEKKNIHCTYETVCDNLKKNTKYELIPPSTNGWIVFSLFISCTPGDFYSETSVILETIIPTLNNWFLNDRIYIIPRFMYNGIDADRYTLIPTTLHPLSHPMATTLAIPADYSEAICRSAPFFIQLIGEKSGLNECDPEILYKANMNNFMPILEREYELSKRFSSLCSVVMIRRPVAAMGVPSALMRYFTDDPSKLPRDDILRSVKEKVAVARGEPPSPGYFDSELEKKRWLRHVMFVQRVRKEHAGAMLCDGYSAQFSHALPSGHLCLKGLEGFAESLTSRLYSIIQAYFDLNRHPETNNGNKHDDQAMRRLPCGETISFCSADQEKGEFFKTVGFNWELSLGTLSYPLLFRHASTNYKGSNIILCKLDMYAFSPANRSMRLLHGAPSCGTTSSLRAFVERCNSNKMFVTIYYGAKDGGVWAEPGDPRSMFLAFIYQLEKWEENVFGGRKIKEKARGAENNNNNTNKIDDMKNSAKYSDNGVISVQNNFLPSHITHEVSIERIMDIFTSTLTRVSKQVQDKVIILVIDDIDDIDNIMTPANTLRIASMGDDLWLVDPGTTNVYEAKAGTGKSAHTTATGAITTTIATITADVAKRGRSPFSTQKDKFVYIPICLPKNVRIVCSCKTDSEAYRLLQLRGRDSCELLSIPELSEAEVAKYIKTEILALFTTEGVHGNRFSSQAFVLPDEATVMSIIIQKNDAFQLCYLHIIKAVCEHYRDVPLAISLDTYLKEVPPTTEGACAYWLSIMEHEMSVSFVKKALSVLLLSRWGLLEVELGQMMAIAMKVKGIVGGELPGEILYRFIRLLSTAALPVREDVVATSPVNALQFNLFISHRTFKVVAKERYFVVNSTKNGNIINKDNNNKMNTPSSYELRMHRLMSNYYQTIMWRDDSPLQLKALRECAYHSIAGHRWHFVEDTITSLSFISKAFELGIAYQLLREYVNGYNYIESLMPDQFPSRCRLLLKLKEYVYFIRDRNTTLISAPHMAHQIAITAAPETFVYKDAQAFFSDRCIITPHFVTTPRSQTQLHKGFLGGCKWAPNGTRFATCGEDRSICICDAANGSTLFVVKQGDAKLLEIGYNYSGQYIYTTGEDRIVQILDANISKLVTRLLPHDRGISCITMSFRGKFTVTAGTGSEEQKGSSKCLKIYDTESGENLVILPHQRFVRNTGLNNNINNNNYGGGGGLFNSIVPHYADEYVFYVAYDNRVLGWRMNSARDNCDLILDVTVHKTQPVRTLICCHPEGDEGGEFLITCVEASRDSIDEEKVHSKKNYENNNKSNNNIIINHRMRNNNDNLSFTHSHSAPEATVKLWYVGDEQKQTHHHYQQHQEYEEKNKGTCYGQHVANLDCRLLETTGLAALSKDQSTLIVAFVDGSCAMYDLPWNFVMKQIKESRMLRVSEIMTIPLGAYHRGYRHHNVEKISRICFNHNDSLVAVAGNLRQIKVYNAINWKANATSAITIMSVDYDNSENSNFNNDHASNNAKAINSESKYLHATEEKGNMLPINDNNINNMSSYSPYFLLTIVAEYLLEVRLTCFDWTPVPLIQEQDAPELIAGDVAGRIHMLRLVDYK